MHQTDGKKKQAVEPRASAQSSFSLSKQTKTNKQKKNFTNALSLKMRIFAVHIQQQIPPQPFHISRPLSSLCFINSLNSKLTFTLLTPWRPRAQQMANKLVWCNHLIFFSLIFFSFVIYDGSFHRLRQSVCRRPPAGGPAPLYTRLYSFRLSCRMVSLTAAKTKRMFSVSVAQVKWE